MGVTAITQLENCGAAYNIAKSNNDKEGMAAAHAAAEEIRDGSGRRGGNVQGTADGNTVIVDSSGNSTVYTSSNNSEQRQQEIRQTLTREAEIVEAYKSTNDWSVPLLLNEFMDAMASQPTFTESGNGFFVKDDNIFFTENWNGIFTGYWNDSENPIDITLSSSAKQETVTIAGQTVPLFKDKKGTYIILHNNNGSEMKFYYNSSQGAKDGLKHQLNGNGGWALTKPNGKGNAVNYKELNSDYWNRTDVYFDGLWWQDEKKLREAAAVIRSEIRYFGAYQLNTNLGYKSWSSDPKEINKRMIAIQALSNTSRTGYYDEDTLAAIETHMALYGMDFSNHTLNEKKLDIIIKRYGEILFKESGNKLEAGWGDVIDGLMLLGGGYSISRGKVSANGKSSTKQNTEKTFNTQKTLQGFADEVNQAIPGKGSVVGTNKHSLFKQKVDALGNPNLATERTFLNGQEVSYGTKGGVRVDVIEYNANGTVTVYDLKTGSATLTQSRITQIQNAVNPANPISVTVVQIK